MDRDEHLDVSYCVWSNHEPSSVPNNQRINLLFLHGSQIVKEAWNYYVKLCFEKWGEKLDKVILIDMINNGDTALINYEKTNWFSHWMDLAHDNCLVVHDVINRGELEGPLVVLGHSLGGSVALFMANIEPNLFAGIVVFDPVWGWDPAYYDTPAFSERFTYIMSKLYENARDTFDSDKDYDTYMNTRYVSRTFHPSIKADIEKYSQIKDSQGKVHMKMNRIQQVGHYVSSLCNRRAGQTIFGWTPVPVLALSGDIDDFTPPGSAKKLASILPFSEYGLVKGGGHVVFYEKPHETFELLAPFVEKVTVVKYPPKVPSSERAKAPERAFKVFLEGVSKGGPIPKL